MLPGDGKENLINTDAVQDAKNAGADPLETRILYQIREADKHEKMR